MATPEPGGASGASVPPHEQGEPREEPPPHAPRVLTFDGTTQTFAIYDAAGNVVHDLWPLLEIDGPTASVWVSWDETTIRTDNMFGLTLLKARAAGMPDALPTRLIVARQALAGTHVEVWALDGEVLSALEVPERWEHFALSPAGGYLLVERPHPDASWMVQSAVIRIADGELVWQGRHDSAAFSRDDAHFVFTPGSQESVGLIDLATGDQTEASNPDLYTYGDEVMLSLEACSNDGAVLRTYGFISDGQPLWSLDWDGELRPFEPTLPRLAEEIFWEFRDDGASVFWQRQAKEPVNGLMPIDPALIGFFEHELASGDNRNATYGDYDCPDGRANRFELREPELELAVCDCTTDACDVVVPLAALGERWTRSTQSSADGNYALLSYGWPWNAAPDEPWPDSVLFDADGQQRAELASGPSQFDRYSQLLYVRYSTKAGTGIVELATGHQTWIDTPFSAQIVYE